jgi:hypothetical protein
VVLKVLRAIACLSWLILIVVASSSVGAPTLKITVSTSKPLYLLNEDIDVQGELTCNERPLSSNLVGIEITGPDGLALSRTLQTDTNGDCNMTFNLPKKNVKLGNYTIYAATYLDEGYQTETDTEQFTVILLGDINKDYVINMKDIATDILLFQTTPSSPNWNPDADINKDGVVNMRDIAALVHFFGNSAIP